MFIVSVIWFERFGSDLKRTLTNRLVSDVCWVSIQFFLICQSIDVVTMAGYLTIIGVNLGMVDGVEGRFSSAYKPLLGKYGFLKIEYDK